jgi:hypothetical protein
MVFLIQCFINRRESLKSTPAAVRMFHWSFLAAPYPLPETLIQADYKSFLTLMIRNWASEKHGHKVLEVLDTYIDAYKNEGVIRGGCEDYRAGATIDIDNENADLVWQHKFCSNSSRKKESTSRCRHFYYTVLRIWEYATT